jgi:hypothetical protein
MPPKILGRSHDGHRNIRRNSDGDHVLGHVLTQPDTGVEAIRDDAASPSGHISEQPMGSERVRFRFKQRTRSAII